MVFVLGWQSVYHIYKVVYFYGSYDMDVTNQTLLLVCKLSALGYNYQDGMTDAAKLSEYQRKKAVI